MIPTPLPCCGASLSPAAGAGPTTRSTSRRRWACRRPRRRRRRLLEEHAVLLFADERDRGNGRGGGVGFEREAVLLRRPRGGRPGEGELPAPSARAESEGSPVVAVVDGDLLLDALPAQVE